jgi:hypothetical protein
LTQLELAEIIYTDKGRTRYFEGRKVQQDIIDEEAQHAREDMAAFRAGGGQPRGPGRMGFILGLHDKKKAQMAARRRAGSSSSQHLPSSDLRLSRRERISASISESKLPSRSHTEVEECGLIAEDGEGLSEPIASDDSRTTQPSDFDETPNSSDNDFIDDDEEHMEGDDS